MAYPARPRQSARIVTTNAEESAEAEVADRETVKAKGRIICNVNQECMFRMNYRPHSQSRAYLSRDYEKKCRYNQSEAEIKKDGR